MYSSVDTIWVLLGAALVFFMQPGFCILEAGLTRAKNAGNIVMKNLMDFCLGTIVFWLIGFGIMQGTDIGGIIGAPDFLIGGDGYLQNNNKTYLNSNINLGDLIVYENWQKQ